MRRLLTLLLLGSALGAEDFATAQKALEAALNARPGRGAVVHAEALGSGRHRLRVQGQGLAFARIAVEPLVMDAPRMAMEPGPEEVLYEQGLSVSYFETELLLPGAALRARVRLQGPQGSHVLTLRLPVVKGTGESTRVLLSTPAQAWK